MKTYSYKINDISYRFTVEEVLLSQIKPLLGTINMTPLEKIKDGYKIQVGFSLFILRKNADNSYTILVPDYTKNPFEDTTEDLTLALGIQFEQLDILNSYKISATDVRFDDKIVVAKNALNSEHLTMQRFADLDGSGWCIYAVATDENGTLVSTKAEGYESCYAFQLLRLRYSLVKLLPLPYNYMAIIKGDEILDILNENNESVCTE